ncbi:hypothetical protein [Streptomyces sp. H27-S2]|uniref:hypothetical protein n=1 Tax=Streptomyces antarcticus TaxID=2996458 RepID=UPI002271236A|nr:hypothetical protein [Streptomyces sp. H27-S2]MCY0948539.1 hypothetical protein [Streptomyces sp. H27-S2]
MATRMDGFEYATYTEKRETCPSCNMPIPFHHLARRGMLGQKDGPPKVAYWHTRCVNADGTRR